MLSAVTGAKFVPTIVTLVPVVPVAGEKLVMDKLDPGAALNVKLFEDVYVIIYLHCDFTRCASNGRRHCETCGRC